MSEQFLKDVQVLLSNFREYQLNNNEPYSFDLLGLMDWMDDELGISTLS